jgi:hypothetical protein
MASVPVKVYQEILATDGVNPSRMMPAGSTGEIETTHANYIIGMKNGEAG